MVVLGILAAVMAVGLPRMRKPSVNIKDVMRNLSLTVKETRAHARLKHFYYRIVFNMKGEDQNYSIESSVTKDNFEADTGFMKKPKKLPDQLFFAQIEKAGGKEPIREGTAYILVTPDGFVDEAAVEITDHKNMTWTLVTHPVTGHVDIFETALSLKDQGPQ